MKLKAASHLTKNLHWAFISNDMWFGFHLIIQKDKMIPQSLSWSLYVQLIWFSEVSELHRKGKKKKKMAFSVFQRWNSMKISFYYYSDWNDHCYQYYSIVKMCWKCSKKYWYTHWKFYAENRQTTNKISITMHFLFA